MQYNLTEADLNKLSDADLESYIQGNLDGMSDGGLEHIIKRNDINQKRWAAGETFDEDGNRVARAWNKKMHPSLSTWDRFVAQNLTAGNSADRKIEYLKTKYPDYEFEKEGSNILMRGPDDTEWGSLDEDGMSLHDYLDVAVDTGLGFAENAGALAAGVTTANPAVGLAARGMLGYLGEGARQFAGTLAGVPNNVDHEDAAISGTLSAGIPVVAENVIRPAWGYVKNNMAPAIGEFMTGTNREILKNINVDEAGRKLIGNLGIDKYAQKVSDDTVGGLFNARNISGKNIENNLSDAPVDLSGVQNLLNDSISMAPASYQGKLDHLKGLLPGDPPKVDLSSGMITSPYMVKPRAAINAKSDYYLMGAGDKTPLGQTSTEAVTNELSNVEKKIARDASLKLRDALKTTSKNPDEYERLASNHSELMGVIGDKRLKPLNDKLGTRKYLQSWNKNKTPGEDEIDQTLVDNVKRFTASNPDGPVDLGLAGRQYNSWQLYGDGVNSTPSMLPPSWASVGKGGTFGTALGTGLGWGLSGHAMGGALGGTAGATLGAFSTSPYMQQAMARKGKQVSDISELLGQGLYNNRKFYGGKALYNMNRESE
jgi:hypothetical protein